MLGDGCRSAGGQEDGTENLDQRGLAGAIRAEQTVHFALIDAERYGVKGDDIGPPALSSVGPCQLLCADA
jgi:hypothetical protein